MSKLLLNTLVGEAPSLLAVNEWIIEFSSVRTWRAGLKPGFFSWLVLVVVWVLNDGLPTVHLLDTLGSYGVCVSAAAMLIAVVFSYLRRDLVGPASLEWLRLAGRIASPVSLPWCNSPVFHFVVETKGKVKGSAKIGKLLSVWVPLSVFPIR